MSQFVLDTFAEARRHGILVPGFVGTYADVQQAIYDAEEVLSELRMEQAAESYYEGGWPGADQYRWEEEQDRLRNPFDPQAWYVADDAPMALA
jgi:hypothetical protein